MQTHSGSATKLYWRFRRGPFLAVIHTTSNLTGSVKAYYLGLIRVVGKMLWGNIAAATRALGVPRTSLRDRLKADDIELAGTMDMAG